MEEISRPMKIMISSLAATMTHWPDDREQQQRVIFAGLGVLAVEVAVGREHGQDADRDHQHAEERGEAIHHQHAGERRAGMPYA